MGQEDPLEKGMATHSSILAWRIPWAEESARLHTVHGVARVRYNLATKPPPPFEIPRIVRFSVRKHTGRFQGVGVRT